MKAYKNQKMKNLFFYQRAHTHTYIYIYINIYKSQKLYDLEINKLKNGKLRNNKY